MRREEEEDGYLRRRFECNRRSFGESESRQRSGDPRSWRDQRVLELGQQVLADVQVLGIPGNLDASPASRSPRRRARGSARGRCSRGPDALARCAVKASSMSASAPEWIRGCRRPSVAALGHQPMVDVHRVAWHDLTALDSPARRSTSSRNASSSTLSSSAVPMRLALLRAARGPLR